MKKPPSGDPVAGSIQYTALEIPRGLAARVEKYAERNDTDLSGVVIEALDTFLRGRNTELKWIH